MVVVPTVDGNGLLHVALDLQCSLLALLQSQLVPNFPHGLVDFFLGLGILLVALSLESREDGGTGIGEASFFAPASFQSQ